MDFRGIDSICRTLLFKFKTIQWLKNKGDKEGDARLRIGSTQSRGG
jgi:hypothetical protein